MKKIKQHSTSWILLVIVIGIWGTIFVKLIHFSSSPEEEMVPCSSRTSEKKHMGHTLMLNYRDPFLGTLPHEYRPTPRKAIPTSPVKVTVSPPSFRLRGKIRKEGTDYLLVDSAGTNYLVQLPGEINGFQVKKVLMDSVIVTRKGKSFTLPFNP